MRPTKLLIFGSRKAGTPLMLASLSIALDFPVRILVWEGDQGKAWVSYNRPKYLKERQDLPQDLRQTWQPKPQSRATRRSEFWLFVGLSGEVAAHAAAVAGHRRPSPWAWCHGESP